MERQSERKVPINVDCDHITLSSFQALRSAVLKVMLVRLHKKAAGDSGSSTLAVTSKYSSPPPPGDTKVDENRSRLARNRTRE